MSEDRGTALRRHNDTEVIVVGSDALTRETLGSALETVAGFRRVDERASGGAASATTRAVVVVAPGDGTDEVRGWVARVRRTGPPHRLVVVASCRASERWLRESHDPPAALVDPAASFDELIGVVRLVAGGGSYCSERIGYHLCTTLGAAARARRLAERAEAHRLSGRELEVLRLVAEGLDNRAIAERLCVSVHTVKNHVHRILDALDVCSRREAAVIAFERGWVAERRRARAR